MQLLHINFIRKHLNPYAPHVGKHIRCIAAHAVGSVKKLLTEQATELQFRRIVSTGSFLAHRFDLLG